MRLEILAWGIGMVSIASVSCASAQVPRGEDNAGLTLPDGFSAMVFADSVGRARHLTVAPNGDVVVALARQRARGDQGAIDGGVVVLRDADGDGIADVKEQFGSGAGDDVEFRGEYLYYSTNDAVMRYPWPAGSLGPGGPADTIVRDLPATRSHRAKSIAFGPDDALYVNVGSPSNSCQEQDRAAGSSGKDPCDELDTRAGIWRFDADRTGQTQVDGRRYATGLRNTVALASHPESRILYGAVHGRDQLAANWSEYFTEAQSAEKPSEELVRIEDGDDIGWPYCYHDPELGHKVLAPEYGGDGVRVGRCDEVSEPLVAFPAHWAPNGLLFYHGDQFPERYRGGAFIAFHGSWNRAPLPQGGYNVVFVPFNGGEPDGDWEIFADGFAGSDVSPRGARHRPVGLAEGPDGALYVSDDAGGRIYKVVYSGNR
jgi:glucose/arabinose dehydrogenase